MGQPMSRDCFIVIIRPYVVDNNELFQKVLLKILNSKFGIIKIKRELLREEGIKKHYAHMRKKPFFKELVKDMTSSPAIIFLLYGDIKRARTIIGATDPKKAEKDTIRQEFGESMRRNVLHCSDSKKTGKKEAENFFPEYPFRR